MSTPNFVHLHLHTQYSVLDGAVRIKEVMKKAVGFGMPAIAMTDHGNLFGAVEFYQEAIKAGIKPVIGCEVYLAPGSRHEKKSSSAQKNTSHLTLLVRNETGYRNLIKLVSLAYLEGFYYKPRVDKELLAAHSSGLIALSGCLKGEINLAIQRGDLAGARQSAGELCDIFSPEHFFLEVHNHGMDAQIPCNRELTAMGRDLGLGMVGANDVHFLERAHHEAHDVMICIGTRANLVDTGRLQYSPELYFKSAAEMAEAIGEIPGAMENTLRIAEMVEFQMEFGVSKYPEYPEVPGKTRESMLRGLCLEGLAARFGASAAEGSPVRERLEYELGVIERMGFVSYFLIVWDFIDFAKRQGIPVGPGRGSAAGALVAYVLGITDIDPFKYGLIFERFLNPERVSPPDIDIDFCVNRRGEVIDYVRQKYGQRSVSQIVTFNTLGAKNTIRDVARVLGISYADADRIARMIPVDNGITLEKAREVNAELRDALEKEEDTAQIWEYATLLEGLVRNTGVHAAGVVIGDRDLAEYVPLFLTKDGEISTQYAMGPLTDLGMLKMDFLGLKNLTVIEETVRLIQQDQSLFEIRNIPEDDKAAFDLINRGETVGVFQLESGGFANVCKRFDVSGIGDISALLAIYRPGPMALIDDYIEQKKGKKKVVYLHPLLEEVTSETYGVMIYQEQVQKAANVLAGYSLGEADLLRRAMSKKDKEKMGLERERFIKGCAETNKISSKLASEIFDLLEKFADYGFNKSHSAAYAVLSYQTAYLKANYPVQFLCGLLSNEISNTDKIAVLVGECQRMKIPILPPDVNRSVLTFQPEATTGGELAIRYGLGAVKNVGEGAMASLVAERTAGGEFSSLEDVCNRLDARTVGKKILESLVCCGALDFTGRDRAEMFASVDSALSAAAHAHRAKAAGQGSLFDLMDQPPEVAESSSVLHYEPWSIEQKLAHEKELLGFYVTGHPLNAYLGLFNQKKLLSTGRLHELEDRASVEIGGIIASVDKKFTKSGGKPFAILRVEDMEGSIEVRVWSETFEKVTSRLVAGNVVQIEGRLGKSEDSLQMTATDVKTLTPSHGEKPLRLTLNHSETTPKDLFEIRQRVLRHPGHRPLEIVVQLPGGQHMVLQTGIQFYVNVTSECKADLAPWLSI